MPVSEVDEDSNPSLYRRAITVIKFRQETRAVEYKESNIWISLQEKITKAAIAMSNLADGGIIVVGISERGGVWTASGISDADLQTFDQDTMAEQINRYSSPPIEISVFIVSEYGASFLVISVSEFLHTPSIGISDQSLRP